MKLNNLDFDDKLDWLKVTDFENVFNIYNDQTKKIYKYNLNETIYFNIDKSALNTYICDTDMYWPLASYKLYHTTHLMWLLMKLNNITAEHIFDVLHAGDKIYYLDISPVKTIIEDMNKN